MNIGKIVAIAGPVVDVEFEEGQLPHIREALTVRSQRPAPRDGSGAAGRGQHGALHHAGGQRNIWPGAWRWRRTVRASACRWAVRCWAVCSMCWATPSTAARPCPQTRNAGLSTARPRPLPSRSPSVEILETGIKVIDLAGALCQGRQDRSVRRRWRGQNGADSGTDPQHRHGARRLLRLHRRGRAQPRGQRPVAGDAAQRRGGQDRAGVRPDERGRPACECGWLCPA